MSFKNYMFLLIPMLNILMRRPGAHDIVHYLNSLFLS